MAMGELDTASLAAANRKLEAAARASLSFSDEADGDKGANEVRPRETLEVTVYEATKLANVDKGRTLYSSDKSDPYVVVTVTPTRGRAMRQQTHHLNDTLEPRWFVDDKGRPATSRDVDAGRAKMGVTLRFAPVTSAAAEIHVLVRDRNTVSALGSPASCGHASSIKMPNLTGAIKPFLLVSTLFSPQLTPDEDLGSVALRLRQLSFKGERELVQWFSLSSSGTIRLGMRWRFGDVRITRHAESSVTALKRELGPIPDEMRAEAGGGWGDADVADAMDGVTESRDTQRPPEGEYSLL
eukprot:scaffold26867_cov28-Tisochrysis_lutea.AAC.4